MPYRRCLVVLVVVLTVLAALPATLPALDLDPASPLPLDPEVTIGKLGNGITYYIRENKKPENRASLRMVVNAGSILEDDDQQGLAHFLEHMAFNGTEKYAKNEIIDFLETIGTQFGPDINAYTSFDETVYMLDIPTDKEGLLDQGIEVLREWAGRITNTDEEVEKERGVVLEEWRLGQGAWERIRKRQLPVLLQDSRYADRMPIGKPEIIENAPPGRIRDFYATWYRPDLMALVAVGDFDAASIEGRIREVFSDIPAPDARIERPVFDVPHHDQALAVGATDPEMTVSTVMIVFKHPRRDESTVGAYRLGMAEGLLSMMLDARLNEIGEKPEAPFVWAGSGMGGFVRAFDSFYLTSMAHEARLPDALQTLMLEVARIRAHGFLESELERAKADYRAALEEYYNERDKTETSDYVDEYVGHFLESEPIPGIEVEYELGLALLDEISLEEVQASIDRLVHRDNMVILASAPEKPGSIPDDETLLEVARVAAASNPDPYEDSLGSQELLTALPGPGKLAERSTDEALGVTRFRYENGVEAWLKPTDFKNDEILFAAVAPRGLADLDELEYASSEYSTYYISEAGVGGFTPTELEKLLAGKTAGARIYIDLFAHGVQGGARPEDLETALQLLYLNWEAPNDREEAFEVLATRVRGILENRQASPEAQFEDRAMMLNYQGHYMFQPPTLEEFAKVDRATAYDIYRRFTGDASGLQFYFVGALDPDAIEPLLARYLGSLPSGAGTVPAGEDPGFRFPPGTHVERVYAGTEPKSSTVISWNAAGELEEMRMFYLRKANDILRIRLRDILREELGGTYSVSVDYNTILPYPGYATTEVSFGCSPENADRLRDVVFAEVAKLKREGPTEEEAAKVREQELRSLEESEEQNGYWLGSFLTVQRLGIDPHRILERRARAESITAAKLHEIVREYYPEDNWTVVVLLPKSAETTR